MKIVKWYNKEFELIFEYINVNGNGSTSEEWFNRIELNKEYLVYVVVNDILWFRDDMKVKYKSKFDDLTPECNAFTERVAYNDTNRFDIIRMIKLKKVLS